MLPRLAIALAAVALAAVLAVRLADHRACEDARGQAFIAGQTRDTALAERQAARIIDRCHDTVGLVAAAQPAQEAGAEDAALRLLETAA